MVDERDLTSVRLTIQLDNNRGTECRACGAECPVRYGLPVDDTGDFVENNFDGEWAGVPACKACYDAHAEAGVAGLKIRLRAVRELSRGHAKRAQRGLDG